MKKYLVTGLAAVAISGMFTSCTHENDTAGGSSDLGVVETYEKAFISRFGTPSPDADWGFGPSTTKAGTRASELLKEKFTLPEFRETNPIVKPELPTTFTFQNTVPSTAKYAKDYQNYQKGDVIYIDTEYQTLNNPQNTEDLTIYVKGNVTYCGQTSSNGNGTVFCVTENSTLTLGAVSTNLIVYLAPGATLDVSKGLKENVISWYPYQAEIVESGNNSFSFQNPHAAIYMSNGSKVKASDLNLVGGAKLLNDGGTIEAENLTLDQQATLWNEGSIKVTNTLTLTNTSSALYNKEGKKIETKNLDLINNDALLFNEGIVEATGDIALHNTDAEIINYGTLSGASYSQAAGGKIHNEDECIVNITGKTDLTNSNSKWQNDGHWTSGSFVVSGTDKNGNNNFNNCRLTVNEEFYLDRGAFILDSGAGVECGSFKIDDTSGFYLGNNSVLKIDGTLTTEIINPEYGFFAYGSEYAAVQANSIVTTTNDPQSINYYGKLLVAIKPHISQYTAESTVKFTKDNQNIATIPETDCNPGYEGEEPGGDDPFEPVIRVIAEDMGDQSLKEASDFDFNDVVFDVTWVSESKVKIKILAAGGTLPLTVGWDGTEDPNDPKAYIKHEVHYMLGYSESTMINTHSTVGNHIDGVAPYEFEFTGTFSKANFAANVRDNIPVKVRKNGVWYDINAEQGRAPGKIAVGTDYNPWCNERVDIDDWWQNNDKQGLFYLYTQSPATLTKFWYKQATYRNGKPISK